MRSRSKPIEIAPSLPPRRRPPAKTVEARENQMIGYAVDLAEKQLLDGSASSQVLTHFLKLATVREQKELERLELEKQLLQAKADSLTSNKDMKEMYTKAINAMRRYGGQAREEYDED